MLVSTPYMDEAMRFDRVIFMNHGRALTQGVPRDLIGHLNGRILELAADPQMAARQIASDDPDVKTFTPLENMCTCAFVLRRDH